MAVPLLKRNSRTGSTKRSQARSPLAIRSRHNLVVGAVVNGLERPGSRDIAQQPPRG
jgi:hypothetical protein